MAKQKDRSWDDLILQVIQIRCMARTALLTSADLELDDIMGELIREETTRVSRNVRELLENLIDRKGIMDEGYCKRSNDKMLARLERKREGKRKTGG